MKKNCLINFAAASTMVFALMSCTTQSVGDSTMNLEGKLPNPTLKGKISLEESLNLRKSVRKFQNETLSAEMVSQLLWAAQGVTHSWGDRTFRTAPSAGATYPMELYVFTPAGGYRYMPSEHSLERVFESDMRSAISEVSLGQTSVSSAQVVFILTFVEERTSQRYRERAFRYICMEAGHIAQNLHLQAVSLGLASVPVGAFDDDKLSHLLKLSENEKPLYIIPVGFEDDSE